MKTTSLKTIEITISPTGRSTVETSGFAGSTCQEASRFIEQALGKTVGEQRTAEFYQPAATDRLKANQG